MCPFSALFGTKLSTPSGLAYTDGREGARFARLEVRNLLGLSPRTGDLNFEVQMATLKIQLRGKNGTHIGVPHVIESSYVPRVGELLDASELLPGWTNTLFFVTSVVGVVKSEGIVPHIVAREWYQGLRAEFLEERGWLPQEAETHKSYDEDEMFE